MTPEFLQWAATLGVGGALAAGMFAVYRKDIKHFTEMWKTMAEQLMLAMKENTTATTKMIAMLEQLERRRSDVRGSKRKLDAED